MDKWLDDRNRSTSSRLSVVARPRETNPTTQSYDARTTRPDPTRPDPTRPDTTRSIDRRGLSSVRPSVRRPRRRSQSASQTVGLVFDSQRSPASIDVDADRLTDFVWIFPKTTMSLTTTHDSVNDVEGRISSAGTGFLDFPREFWILCMFYYLTLGGVCWCGRELCLFVHTCTHAFHGMWSADGACVVTKVL